MTKEAINEYTLKITQANKSRLLVIIYELTEIYINDALAAFNEGDIDAFKDNVSYAEKCISELIGTLDMSKEISGNLAALFVFFIKELSMGMILRNTARIEAVKKLVSTLKDAFEQVADKDTDGPMMGNSQTVYAGLTYGRTSLNESLTESGNRGYKA